MGFTGVGVQGFRGWLLALRTLRIWENLSDSRRQPEAAPRGSLSMKCELLGFRGLRVRVWGFGVSGFAVWGLNSSQKDPHSDPLKHLDQGIYPFLFSYLLHILFLAVVEDL